MNIRTITAGASEADVGRARRATEAARARLEAAGYVVQTTRLALSTAGSNRCADYAAVARGAEELALDSGFDMVSIGRVDSERLGQLAEALAATEVVSASARIALRSGEVDEAGVAGAAAVIAALAASTPGGFGNFRFAASACVGPGSPFFPASYHDGGGPWLAVGPEAAALAVEAASTEGASAPVGRRLALARLTRLVEEHDARIRGALAGVEGETGVYVAGCDWSLAPSPAPGCSVGAAIEALSGAPFGAWGTLAAVRGLTEAVRAAAVDRLGFSGVMLPVLEDPAVARGVAEGRATLRDLLAFSAVCGTGLDTIPLPGDTTPEQLARVLTEVAALGGALRKPLTARLMPLPGRRAGDPTGVDGGAFAGFLCESRVLGVI